MKRKWPDEETDPLKLLREKNMRLRKANHRFRCHICYKTFQNNGNPLQKHIKTHTQEEFEKVKP